MRAALTALLLAGCAGVPAATPIAAPTVAASAETDPVDSTSDAADDPAIWRNAANPAASLVIGTDKQAGIHVYDLAGRRLSFTPAARLNNVDLRETGGRVIVAASDRADKAQAHVALFTLDTVARRLVPMGRYPVGAGEAYGMCLWTRASDKALFGFVVLKDGRIDQVRIDLSGAAPRVETVRSMKLGSQAEGCVVDDRTGLLYVAEEDVGLWRFAADPAAPGTATPIARVDDRTLVADAEGLALAPRGAKGGYLVVSSQGDNAYTLYRLPGVIYAGRFRIGGGAIDGTSDTDGIELALGDFGPAYPKGLFVAQDGDNAPDTQNFKYVGWDKVRKALGL
ncbi:myo-inositol-hexaphosphate 3-phosphohydrolase [Sphingomonas sp. SORGH_AS 950]|uniref:phytase n=1 Tax=Sphingomonas sp. SORGH_AS_0950 TaxID=3041792 RepID=UPI002787B03B|nr:phytase [Sphingomonas sp. SORGH_AS_0950]MDQ1159474.1 myo-inositol-hexaphosphate 3-phosphohydrolase [Sphingomonas sp. SORGH_AS_0950]